MEQGPYFQAFTMEPATRIERSNLSSVRPCSASPIPTRGPRPLVRTPRRGHIPFESPQPAGSIVWLGSRSLRDLEPATGIEPATCGLRNSENPTSDNLTPQETTNQPDLEVGADGT